MDQKVVGNWGEDQAVQFLIRHGFRIVDRNYSTSRGEIDIVAVKDLDYYFVEVKTREAGEMATDEAITFFKKLRLEKAVRGYLAAKRLADVGVVLAGLLIGVEKATKTARFRLAVFLR